MVSTINSRGGEAGTPSSMTTLTAIALPAPGLGVGLGIRYVMIPRRASSISSLPENHSHSM
jgi:hypothetical protein